MNRIVASIIALGLTAVACGPSSSPKKENNDSNNGDANNGGIVIDRNNGEPTNNGDPATNGQTANNGQPANNGVVSNNGNTGGDGCTEDQQRAIVDGVEACYDRCDNGACESGKRCTQGLCLSIPAEDQCATVADCRATQECVAGECVDHQYCYDAYESSCNFRWQDCDDGKEYYADCSYDSYYDELYCSCEVNGVEVDSFTVIIDGWSCGGSNAYRQINMNCGWTNPEP